MKKLNNEHTFLIISTDKKLEIFLPVLAKYGFTYNNRADSVYGYSKVIAICLDGYSHKKKFWNVDCIHKNWITREDFLVIENCSATQLENVLYEFFKNEKSIKLFL